MTFVGCYTAGDGGDGDGIVLAWRERPGGALRSAGTVAATASPSFLIRHPDHPVLYAVNELEVGRLSVFGVAAGGQLAPLGSWATGGAFPCHAAVRTGRDRSGGRADHVVVANYGDGSVTAFALDRAGVPTGERTQTVHTGHGPDPERQGGPHAHMVVPTAGGVLAVDLGTDSVYRHTLDPGFGGWRSSADPLRTPPGFGPRHLVHDRVGRVHVVGELAGSVATYSRAGGSAADHPEWTMDGGWTLDSVVGASVKGPNQPAGIELAADARFLYVGNRGPDTIAVLSIDDGPVRLIAEVPTGGAWPRHHVVVDDHAYVANERSHAVVVFAIDARTGIPAPTGDRLDTPSPTCVLPFS